MGAHAHVHLGTLDHFAPPASLHALLVLTSTVVPAAVVSECVCVCECVCECLCVSVCECMCVCVSARVYLPSNCTIEQLVQDDTCLIMQLVIRQWYNDAIGVRHR